MFVGGMVVFAVTAWCTDPQPTHRNTKAVDSLTAVIGDLEAQKSIVQADVARLTVEKDAVVKERDGLKRASATKTDSLQKVRDALPSSAASAAVIRSGYERSLLLLDSAFVELRRKDQIIRRDSIIQFKQDSIIGRLRYDNSLTQLQYEKQKEISVEWERDYELLLASIPKCQKKCGIAIGVVGLVVTAVVVDKVSNLWKP